LVDDREALAASPGETPSEGFLLSRQPEKSN
jgi:hypothetical protein